MYDFNPQIMRLFLTYRCAYECDHCMMYGSRTSSKFMDFEEASGYITLAAKKGVEMVSLTGGEPFLHPQASELACLVKNTGLDLMIESAYLGVDKGAINRNAGSLAYLNAFYATSINIFQLRSCPDGLDYAQNKVDTLQALLEHEVRIGINIVQCVDGEDDIGSILSRFFLEVGAKLVFDPKEGFSIVKRGKSPIRVTFNPVMMIGRAYDRQLKNSDSVVNGIIEQNGTVYCTQFSDSADVDQLLVHPGGLVHICCQHQREVDFGFGNLKSDGWDKVIDNIRSHSLLNFGFNQRINDIREAIEEKHPELVPEQGFITGCDVCNLYFRKPQLKHEVDELLGIAC